MNHNVELAWLTELIRERATIDGKIAYLCRQELPEERRNMYFACGYSYGRFIEWAGIWDHWEDADDIYSEIFKQAWQAEEGQRK